MVLDGKVNVIRKIYLNSGKKNRKEPPQRTEESLGVLKECESRGSVGNAS